VRKLVIGLIAVVVVVLAAALIGPSFVDWNKYKPEIAERVQAATGREITIAGDLGLSILPAPTLSVHDVTLANLPGASEPNMASLKALDVRVAFLPLLQGRIKVESIALIEPNITLEVLADGRRNWDIKPAESSKAEPGGTAAPAEADGAAGAAAGVQIDSFSIEDGTLTYKDAQSGTTERIEKLNAEIAAESLTGPFSAEGSLVARGIKLEFDGDVGRLEGAAIPVKLDLSLPDADATAKVTGSLSAPTADGEFTGKLSVEADSLAGLAKFAGTSAPLPPPLAQEFSAAADVSGSAKAVSLKELKVALGETIANGKVAVAIGPPLRADVVITLTSLEIDPWLAAGGPAKKAEEKSESKGSGAQAPAATAFSLPTGVAGSLDLTIDAAVYKRDLIRNVKLEAALDNGRLTLNRAEASLPGGSKVSASGILASDGGKPTFDGTVNAFSDNLRGALDWLKVDVAAVPAERLRKFSLTTKIKGNPEQVTITGLVAKLDASELKGGVTVALRERPAFGARFDIDHLNLDGYLPQAAAAGGEAGAKPAPAEAKPVEQTKAPAGGAPALAALNAFDANLQGSIGSLTFKDLQIANIGFDGTLQNGVLTIRDASVGDFGGGSAKLSGVLSGLGGKPEVDAAFDVRVKDPARLMRLANKEPPPVLTRLGPMSLTGKAQGALESFTFNAAFGAAGGTVSAQGNAALAEGGPRYDVGIDVKHGDLPALVRVFSPDYRPAAKDLGGLSLAVRANGNPSMAELSDLQAKIGPVSVQGKARARFDGPRPAFDATLQASKIDANAFLPPKQEAGGGAQKTEGGGAAPVALTGSHWSKEPFDFSALKAADAEIKLAAAAIAYDKYRVDKPEVGLSLKDGVLDIRDLKGSMFDGAFNMNGKLDANAAPKLSGDVTVSKANIKQALFTAGNINVAEGLLDFGMNVAGSGGSPFDLVSSLNGKGSTQIVDGTLSGLDLAALSNRLNNINGYADLVKLLGTSMSGGQTKFSKLGGTFVIDKGVARTNDIEMISEAATGKGEGYVDLPRWYIDMNTKFTLSQLTDVPPFGMRIVGPLDAPERKFDTEALKELGLKKGFGALMKNVLPGQKEGAETGGTTEKPLEGLLKKVVPGQEAPAAPAPAESQTAPPTAAPAPVPEAATEPPAEKPLDTLLKKVLPEQTAPAQPAPAQPAPEQTAPAEQAPAQPAPAEQAPTQPAPAEATSGTAAQPEPAPATEAAPPPQEKEKPLESLFKNLLPPKQDDGTQPAPAQ